MYVCRTWRGRLIGEGREGGRGSGVCMLSIGTRVAR